MARTPTPPEQIEFGLSLARQLVEQRARRNQTAASVAAQSNVGLDTIRALEAGRIGAPGFHTIHALAAVLGLSLDEMAATATDAMHRAAHAVPDARIRPVASRPGSGTVMTGKGRRA